MKEKKKGFTLLEMLVVIGIIVVLVGASIGGFSKMRKSAERAKAQELVSNTATALTTLFQRQGSWPKALRSSNGRQLDANAALALARGGYMSLTTDKMKENSGKLSNDYGSATKLAGLDRFGVVTPWARDTIKRVGDSASLTTRVPSGGSIQDHIVYYALDLDGDGIIEGVDVGGESVNVRASAIVWCCGKDGKLEKHSVGRRKDDCYSWSYGQSQDVK